MRQVFYCKVRQFITKCDSYYKCDVYYKIAIVHALSLYFETYFLLLSD